MEEATEATVALVAGSADSAIGTLSALGPVTNCGSMSFVDALDLQGGFYDDGTDAQQAVFQIDRLPGREGDWWATVEPNGFRMSFATTLQTVTAGLGAAFSGT